MRTIALALVALFVAGCAQTQPTPPTATSDATTTTSSLLELPTTLPPAPVVVTPSNQAPVAPADPLHWHGTVDLTSSLYLLPWQTLTIDPGTVIRMHKQPDIDGTPWIPEADAYIKDHNDPTGHAGYQTTHVQVYGKVIALGTKAAPILFTSAEAKPEYADWNQLVLATGSHLENVTAEYAHNGINVNGDHVVLRNIKVHDSLWSCIDSFGNDVVMRDIEAYHCWHQAVGFKHPGTNLLDGAFLHDAQVAVNCEGGATPTLLHVTIRAATMAPACGSPAITALPGASDVAGGTYGGVLVYPYQR